MLKLLKSEEVINEEYRVNGRIELIQQLIPLGLEAVRDVLEQEVISLVGDRYRHNGSENTRWGSNPGSVHLGGQKLAVEVPRVRNKASGKEVSLESYNQLRDQTRFNEQVFRHVINGISSRKYEKVAEQVPEVFGIKKSTISRQFKVATANKLKELFERDLSGEDIIAIFIDGKSLRGVQVVVALGVTMGGKKIPLGFIETATENAKVCGDFIDGIIARGLNTEQEILFIVDGSKGIAKAIKTKLGDKAVIQRCQWHKRENVVSYLPKSLEAEFRRKLQAAYEEETYDKARKRLGTIRKELTLVNQDAANSLDEGLEETLTLHRLGVFAKMGRSFKTTNCIENLNRGLQQYIGRVCKWKNSDQRRRWVASALLEIEKNFALVEGHRQLPLLRHAMRTINSSKKEMTVEFNNQLAA